MKEVTWSDIPRISRSFNSLFGFYKPTERLVWVTLASIIIRLPERLQMHAYSVSAGCVNKQLFHHINLLRSLYATIVYIACFCCPKLVAKFVIAGLKSKLTPHENLSSADLQWSTSHLAVVCSP